MGPKLKKKIGRLIIHGQLHRLRLASDAPLGTFIPEYICDIFGRRATEHVESETPGISKINLQVCNPNLPTNIVQYDYLDGVYVFIPPDHTINLYEQEPILIRKEALKSCALEVDGDNHETAIMKRDEVEFREDEEGNLHPVPPAIIEPGSSTFETDEESMPESGSAQTGSHTQEEDEDADDGYQLKQSTKPDDCSDSESEYSDVGSNRINLFSHCERGTQTVITRMKNVSNITTSLALKSFSGNANLYEFSVAYEICKKKAKLETAVLPPYREEDQVDGDTDSLTICHPVPHVDTIDEACAEGDDDPSIKKPGLSPSAFSSLKSSASIVERMLSQCMFDEYAQDLKYFEDAADDFRDNEGTLLPLWRFAVPLDVVRSMKETPAGICVRTVAWNPKYFDLLAIGFGSDEHDFDGTGIICLYALKNAFYPEKVYKTISGVTSLSFNESKPYLLAAATEDGSVYVYSLHKKMPGLLYENSGLLRKGNASITQIKWIRNQIPDCPTFVTVSNKGDIHLWLIYKGKLTQLLVSTIPFLGELPEEVDHQEFRGSCTCIAINPADGNRALIGTEEGSIYMMNLESDTLPTQVFLGHCMPITNVRWNPFHSSLLISSSHDGTLRIWDTSIREPLLVYELSDPLTDVAWAPYSSTVFATVSAAGKAYVFDLSVRKYEPICVQRIATKDRPKLTRIEFNAFQPLLIIGEESGFVGTYKLSPNLRKTTKVLEEDRRMEVEVAKLEKLRKLLIL